MTNMYLWLRRRLPLSCGATRWFVVAFFLAAVDPAKAGEPLVLVAPLDTVDTLISEVIVRKAYRRLGMEVVIRKYPAERAIRLADAGQVDGEVQRIDGIANRYLNLVQVDPPVNYIDGTVFSKGIALPLRGWEGLAPYRVGIIRGIKFAERATQDMDVRVVGNYAALFRKLDEGLFDVAISPRVNGLYQIYSLGLEHVKEVAPTVERYELFHYLNRRHADLVPRISAVLKQMRDTGELAAIRQRVVRVLLDRARRQLPICDADYACFEDEPSPR